MKSLFSFLFLACGLLCLTSCEQTVTFEVPTIADQFISFNIDGQAMTLRGIPDQGYEPSRLGFIGEENFLTLSRSSADVTTTFTIISQDLPLERQPDGMKITNKEFVSATISVVSSEMSGSIYCPHTVPGTGVPIEYEGLVRVEELSDEGRIKGSFKSDPAATGNAVTITNGTFELIIPIF